MARVSPLDLGNLQKLTLGCPRPPSGMRDMFSAGTETTSMSLVWAMSELMRHPKAMSAAQTEVRKRAKGKDTIEEGDIDDLPYVKLVIKESLRLHPPVPLLVPRVCSEDCEVGGFDIPKGSRILINVWAIARDPVFWKDPDSFYPERFDDNSIDFRGASFEYLPFGGGRRICPGIAFGIASMELALARILFHFDWELPGGVKPQDLDMTESFGATLGRKSDLWLIAKPHIASHCSS